LVRSSFICELIYPNGEVKCLMFFVVSCWTTIASQDISYKHMSYRQFFMILLIWNSAILYILPYMYLLLFCLLVIPPCFLNDMHRRMMVCSLFYQPLICLIIMYMGPYW
jgi:hypothetical protein